MSELQIGTGCSQAKEGALAGRRAVEQALREFKAEGGEVPEFGLLFCSGGKYRESVEELVEAAYAEFRSANDELEWMGCTTAGEIFRGELRTGSCIALVLSSPHIEVSTGSADGVHDDPVEAGREATAEALEGLAARKGENEGTADSDTSSFLLALSPGLTWDAPGREDEVIEGIRAATDGQVPVVGGTAGDDSEFTGNHQFVNGEAYQDALIISAVSTEFDSGFSFGNGFKRTKKSCQVTKSSGFRVEELDGEPALERYADLLEVETHELWDVRSKKLGKYSEIPQLLANQASLPEPYAVPFIVNANLHPFGVVGVEDGLVVRAPQKTDGESLEFNQKVPEDVDLRLLEYDKEVALMAEKKAIRGSLEYVGQNPGLVFLADCALRKATIGEENMENVFSEIRGNYPEASIFGFYSMGEYTSRKEEEPTANCHSVSVGCIGSDLVNRDDTG